ncbi:MAG: DUF3098 domain-containing protein [Balneolia bacterium]|nr:DUF3098 domain-containing protein [Balneolia bacterium]
MPRKDPKRKRKSPVEKEVPIFSKQNYQLMAGGAGLVFLGFTIMAMENEIDGFVSLFISPILVIAGFIVFGFGIMKKKSDANEAGQSNPA